MLEAQKTYCKLRNEFVREYGSYHMTFSIGSDDFRGFFEDVFRIIQQFIKAHTANFTYNFGL